MYTVVTSQADLLCKAIAQLEKEVNALQKNGWVEQGGVSISATHVTTLNSLFWFSVAQAMVKKDD